MGKHPNVINEEAIYVLDGKGVLRIEGEEVEIKKRRLHNVSRGKGGAAPGGSKEKRTLHKYLRNDSEVDYWNGEE